MTATVATATVASEVANMTTVSTVTSVTSVTSTGSFESVAAFGVVVIVALIAMLITKELAGASENARAKRLAKIVNVGVVPLAFAFLAIVVSRLTQVA